MGLPALAEQNVVEYGETLLRKGPPVAGTVALALFATALGLGGFGYWAATAPLASGAVAAGEVRVDTNRKTVQHFEGGIVRELLVREGQRVRAGQALVRLDPLAAQVDRAVLQNRLVTAMAEEARLVAERDLSPRIDFPKEVIARKDAPEIAAVLRTQTEMFDSQRRALEGEIAVHTKRIDQARALIASLAGQVESTRRQLALINEEAATAREMLRKGYERKPRVLALERRAFELEGERTALEGKIATSRETIAESEASIEALRRKRGNAVAGELDKARSRRAEAEEQLRKASDQLKRTDVLAPQSGVVLGLKYFAPGAVVPAGGAILDIVPDDERLVMTVRVSPLDIDVVREGLSAEVRFVAYKQRITPTLSGRVVHVSPDAVTDQKSQLTYYLARLEVGAHELGRVPAVKLYPGMPVEAVILTGDRTLLDYLLRPVLDSFAKAFREQ